MARIVTEVCVNGRWIREGDLDQLNYIDPVHSAASTLGRLGGLVKSEAKAISSRENGKKGGRPRKVREEGAEIGKIDSSNLDLFGE